MEKFAVPDAMDISRLFAMLISDDVEVEPAAESDSGVGNGAYVGNYVATTNDETAAVCVFDIDLAAYTGASLTMLPADVAKEAIADKELTKIMRDNVYEVMNIVSRSLMNKNTPHLKLEKLYAEADAPDSVKQLLSSAGERCVFKVTVPNYGVGHLSVFVN